MPGEKKGIDYILAYLRRLNAESSLLRRFDPALAARLLQGCAPDFGELPLNLCEPVLACAVGLLLADAQAQTLNMTDRERGRLAELLSGGAREVRRMLAGATDELCRSLGVPEEDGAYLAAAAAELCPRILAALPAKRLENVFPSLGGV